MTAWEGTLTVGDAPADVAVEVVADTASLKVREGHGGMQALGDDDKANIETTIHDEILKRDRITFRSTGAEPGADGRVTVHGDMTMLGDGAPRHRPDARRRRRGQRGRPSSPRAGGA